MEAIREWPAPDVRMVLVCAHYRAVSEADATFHARRMPMRRPPAV